MEILNTIIEKAKLGDAEKSDFLEQLRTKDLQIHELKRELYMMRRFKGDTSRSRAREFIAHASPEVIVSIQQAIKNSSSPLEFFTKAPMGLLRRNIALSRKEDSSIFDHLHHSEIINLEGSLTELGALVVRQIAKDMLSDQ